MKKQILVFLTAALLSLSSGCSLLNRTSLTPEEALQKNALYSLENCDPADYPDYMEKADWETVPVFTEAADITAYLEECYEARMGTIAFIMEGEPPDSDVFLGNTGMMTTARDHFQMDFEEGGLLRKEEEPQHISYVIYEVCYSTGVLVLDAYRSGDTSKLDARDRKVYDMAVDFIQNKLDKSASLLQQELQIYDYIRDSCLYYNVDSDGKREDFRMATGVFLDGKANCMGYTDAFYMLGNMAGFQVETDMNEEHTWNIIGLDGKSYLVDVTEGEDALPPDYLHFNFSKKLALELGYEWKVDSPTDRMVVEETDENYYYLAEEQFAVPVDSPEALCDLAVSYIGMPLRAVYEGELPEDMHQRISDRISQEVYYSMTLTTTFHPSGDYTFIFVYCR